MTDAPRKPSPSPLRALLRRVRARLRRGRRGLGLYLGGRRGGSTARVFYGHRLPRPGEVASGGIIKFQRLAEVVPNSPRRFNLLYLGSNNLPADWPRVLRIVRRRGVRILYNQNGVAYPGWYGPGWEEANLPMATLHREADHVVYQSRFCRDSARRFLGPRVGPSEVLHNAVDTDRFTPGPRRAETRPLRLLLSGKQYLRYSVETAVRTLAALAGRGAEVRLLITGELTWAGGEAASRAELDGWLRRLGIGDRVDLLGPYSQREAPAVHRRADLLLHPKYNDACPSGVIEAMACGLPVVYSHSGGVPELVGDEAGLAVPVDLDWERMVAPDPELLADRVLAVAADLERFADAARQRAVDRFGLDRWVERHREIFAELLTREPEASHVA